MATAASYQAKNTSIVVDLRKDNTLYGDDQTRYIAISLCTTLLRQKNYIGTLENQYIKAVLGEETLNLANKYIEVFKDTGARTKERHDYYYNKLVYPFNLSLEKCENLKRFIQESPWIALAKDEFCKSSDGTVMLTHTITISSEETHIEILATEKLAAIQAIVKGSKVNIEVVSETGWRAIQETISGFQPSTNVSVTVLYDPLPVHQSRQAPQNTSGGCCAIL